MPQGGTGHGSHHTALSTQVSSLLCSLRAFKGKVAAATQNNPPSLPALVP